MTKAQTKQNPVLELGRLYKTLNKIEKRHDLHLTTRPKAVLVRQRMVKKGLSLYRRIREVERHLFPLASA